jgi:hypothetical protein
MTNGALAIYFVAADLQDSARRRAAEERRAMYARPDCPPDPVASPDERRRIALGSLRRWFAGVRTADALR